MIRQLLPKSGVNQLKRWRTAYRTKVVGVARSSDYWTRHHVQTPGEGFRTVAQSLAHYNWRNRVNPGHIELMPVDDVSGRVVLDYGCGPGNDIVGFGHFSRPARLLACDVSPTALAIARQRAALHDIKVEFSQLQESPVSLPYEDACIDVIHSAGVLHHTPDPTAILEEFHRVLKPGGEVRIMVYNRDSIWMHLYVSFVLMIEQGQYRGMSPDEAFHLTTDGESCPIARCYRPEEFLAAGSGAGFDARFLGAGVTITELQTLPRRWSAIQDRRLAEESRDFLYFLRLNDRGWPLHEGSIAGINGYYRFHQR
jgi:ubiquinone/menaquinone biosynthesis C-methylase UbiE